MVSSMTGYGRGEATRENRRFTIEMKSVNNRYLDLNFRMPKLFHALEARLRAELKTYMRRGKVDVFLSYEDLTKSDVRISYHPETARAYYNALSEIAGEFGLENDISVTRLASFPDVLTTEETRLDEEALWEGLEEAVRQAGEQFAASRRREGEFLKEDLLEKLRGMEEDVSFIAGRAPQIVEDYQRTLREKMAKLLEDRQVDEGRLLTEAAIFADRVSVDEELVRLRSHIETVRQTLLAGDEREGIGRKLDFLAQELNREANTILSKSSDLEVSERAVRLKTEIEKIREQIQNIE